MQYVFGYVYVPMCEIAEYRKERIGASSLNEDNYVSVENLLQNRQGKTMSKCVPNIGNFIKYQINDILIGNIRPYLKKIWLADIDGGTNGDVLPIHIKSNYQKVLCPRFLYHILASDNFFDFDMQSAKGAKMPRGDKDSIMNYPILLPPLSEQERIVAILDKFDALVNDISIGLPAEIEARRKQYEYYRNKLLAFKEKTA